MQDESVKDLDTTVPEIHGRLSQVRNTCVPVTADESGALTGVVFQFSIAMRLKIETLLFQFTAPEGFSARRSAPARTVPGVAGSPIQAYSFPSSPFSFGWAELCHSSLET
jgi:hypothetical protein